MRLSLFILCLIIWETQVVAEQKWVTHSDTGKTAQHEAAKVPPSRKIPLNIPYVEGCGYNSDGSIFVSAGALMKNISREGKELSTTKFEVDKIWSSPNFKTFLGKTEQGTFKLIRNGKETKLPETAFAGTSNYPLVQISPLGSTIIASLDKEDGKDIPLDSRKDYYGVFNEEGKQKGTLKVPQGAKLGDFSPDGKKILGTLILPPRLFLLDIQDGKITYLTALDETLHADLGKEGKNGPYENSMWRLAPFTPDGKNIALSTNRLLAFNLQKQELKYEERNIYQGYERIPENLDFTPDAKTLIYSVRGSNNVRRLELRRLGPPVEKVTLDIPLPGESFSCTAFDPESGKLLAIEGANDPASGNPTYWAREFQLADLFKLP